MTKLENLAIRIRAGGQTGVDRAALDFAVRHKRPYAGWCPRDGRAEDHETDRGLLDQYPNLTETPSREPEQRTAWNVRDSHATIILVRGDELAKSRGTIFTRHSAELVFLRPCLVVDLTGPEPLSTAREWLERTASGLGVDELILNIAGPRESEAPGIYEEAGRFLEDLLGPCLAAI
ncbi:MAG TPA: putative molybdenum carrier protein [Blastocatellia bacterium]|nr:putative molybdenum carrier protein [Blastocatellia bacterium]